MKPKLVVYLAGPLSVGDLRENIQKAMEQATRLMQEGYVVVIPHLDQYLQDFWDEVGINMDWGYEEWLAFDFELLAKCDVLFRMPGESPGADQEVAFAMGRMIDVVHSEMELKTFKMNWERRLEL